MGIEAADAIEPKPPAVPALHIEHLTKRFVVGGRRKKKTVVAVNDVSLRIERGEIYGLLGANGSGKSTFIRLVSTLLTVEHGRVEVFGHDIDARGDGRQAADQPGQRRRRFLQEAVAGREPDVRRAAVRRRRRLRAHERSSASWAGSASPSRAWAGRSSR